MIPPWLALTPRMMFPPPITIPVSTPAIARLFISPAIYLITSGSIPKPELPASASPENLTKTRLGFIFILILYKNSQILAKKALKSVKNYLLNR